MLNSALDGSCPPTLDRCLVRGEDAGISTGRGADVEVELHVVLQPVAVLLALREDGLLLVLFAGTGEKQSSNNQNKVESR